MNVKVKGIKLLEDLRVSSLGVIVRLVEEKDTNTEIDPERIHFLLETNVFPKCLRCIHVGSELAKKVVSLQS